MVDFSTVKVNMPKVSVIIPTYNRANYICEAIDSVLNQTYQYFEIIVVDDGSTDSTKEVLKRYSDKIRYIYQNNKGEAGARNTGIKISIGKYIAFLDSDDIWFPKKLERQVEILEKHPDIGLVYCPMIVDGESNNGSKMKPSRPALNFEDLFLNGCSIPPTVLIRNRCFEKAGLFDEELTNAPDYDMWLRVTRYFKVEFIKEPLARYRIHDSNISKNTEAMHLSGVKIYRKFLSDNYINIPLKFRKQRLVKEHYLLAKIYLDRGNLKYAQKEFQSAIRIYPLIGSIFIIPKDTICKKMFKLVKPYLAWSYCFLKRALQS